jgi:HTH-type transcriptional regulator/antitoxin HigA
MKKALAEAFPPGDYLSEELEARNWSQVDFAEILGRPTQFVSEIISGKKEITRESAAQIGAALGTSPEVWLNLQNGYLLWKQHQNDAIQRQLQDVRRRARLNELAPVAVLKKRGLLKGNTLDELENGVKDLLELRSLDDEPFFTAAARRSNTDVPLTPTQFSWLASTRKRARELKVKKYDSTRLAALAERLSRKLDDAQAFELLPELLAPTGVRLVYLEAFPGSKMNGATFLLDDDPQKPVIALSGRGKRLDVVLFTLLHEIAHLVRGDVQPGKMAIDDELHTLGDEEAANDLATKWAVPGGLDTPPRPVRQQWVTDEAARLGVNQIVVIGQLQKRNELDWRTQLVKGAPTVTEEMDRWHRV